MMRVEDARKLLLRDYDPFLSLVRPHGEDTSELDEEYRALAKSYEDQKRSGAITSSQPKKTELQSLKKVQRLPHVITSTAIGSNSFKYRLSSFGKLSQKSVHDPVIATWLDSEFERDDGASVPRGLMYNAYLEFCRVNKHCVSNQACFGKVVRNTFPHLQTRRIGGRGNSKYHYFGIRPKPGTETTDFFAERESRHRKSTRALKKTVNVENLCHETNKVDVPKEQIKSEAGECDDFKALIKILIPNFPTHDDLNVPEDIATEAHTLLGCMEKYAFDTLRALMQISEKPDFKEVFFATAGFWSTVSKALDDTELTNPDILELMSECDIQVQRTMKNIVLPDLLAPVSEEKTENLTILFGGVYLREMMAAVWPAHEQVRQTKRKVYKSFSIDMIQRLNFMQLVNKVEEWLEEKPMAEILKKAFQKLDVNSLMTKCRFAFAMKKSDSITTEKTFRKGLTTFQASLTDGFYLRDSLIWVRSLVLDQIQQDKQHQDCKARITVTLLCFSYAVSLLFAELTKHCPLPLQSGLRNIHVLLTDFVSYAVKDELKSVK